MTPTKNDIENTFKAVHQMMGNPEQYRDVTEQIILLADQIDSFEGEGEEIWYIGEGLEFGITDLLVGAYWHFSEWHNGQESWHFSEWHNGQESLSHAALSALGSVFTPNMSQPPTEDEPEHYPFQSLDEMARIYWARH